MTELQRATTLLQRGYTCILCDRDRILTSKKSGIAPLLERYESGENAADMCAADRIVGKAAAMLLTLMGVRAVYGEVMSSAALTLLQERGIEAAYGTLVPSIVNRSGDGPCPMEAAVASLMEPVQAPSAIRRALDALRNGR